MSHFIETDVFNYNLIPKWSPSNFSIKEVMAHFALFSHLHCYNKFDAQI